MTFMRFYGRMNAWVGVVLISCLLAHSDEATAQWWLNSEQRGAALVLEDPMAAAELLKDPKWKALALHQAGHHQQSLNLYPDAVKPNDLYNKATILAHLGQINEAMKLYEQTLSQQPSHEDAHHNLEYLRSLLERSPQSHPQPNQDGDSADTTQNADQHGPSEQGSDSSAARSDGARNPLSESSSQSANQSSGDSASSEQTRALAEATPHPDDRSEDEQRAMNHDVQPKPDRADSDSVSESAPSTGQPELQNSQLSEALSKLQNNEAQFWKRKFQRQYQKRRYKP